MKVFIHSLEETLYEGEASVAILPGEGGEISVLDGHIPLATALSKGTISVKVKEGHTVKDFPISGGFAEVNGNHLIILAN
jgi:F-type H+-transporting ATPase subunit epsilon